MSSFTVDPFLIFGEIGNGSMLEDSLFDWAGARKLFHLATPTFRAFFVTYGQQLRLGFGYRHERTGIVTRGRQFSQENQMAK